LSLATPEAVRVLDASGYRWVVVETVGVGQVEVEVAGAADTTVVVVNPGWGDAVQANKAGLMEIADLFVVNKADRAGAAETRRDLESMLALGAHHDDPPAIVEAVATIGTGVAEVWAAVVAHRDRSIASGERDRRRAERVRTELREVVEARLREEAVRRCAGAAWDDAVAAVRAGDLDPWAAASRLLD
jgi:LAO/AO transport system kinase